MNRTCHPPNFQFLFCVKCGMLNKYIAFIIYLNGTYDKFINVTRRNGGKMVFDNILDVMGQRLY